VKVCSVCRRIISITWNRRFAPHSSEDDFDLASFRLPEYFAKLLQGVERDSKTRVEPFADLPLFDDRIEFPYELAKRILTLAGILFRKDSSRNGVNAPVTICGDIHGEITALWEVHFKGFRSQNGKVSQRPGLVVNLKRNSNTTSIIAYSDTTGAARGCLRQRRQYSLDRFVCGDIQGV
jgi:hypothetical protein